MKHITQELIKELFTYKQGKLIRRVDRGKRYKAGDIAGNTGFNGYRRIRINGISYYTHRLIWLYHYGYMPKYLDHKYGKEIGDYLWNLRPSSHCQNMANSKMPKNNTSGIKGVFFKHGRWHARITHDHVIYYLGGFKKKREAASIVAKKRTELHGKFANHG